MNELGIVIRRSDNEMFYKWAGVWYPLIKVNAHLNAVFTLVYVEHFGNKSNSSYKESFRFYGELCIMHRSGHVRDSSDRLVAWLTTEGWCFAGAYSDLNFSKIYHQASESLEKMYKKVLDTLNFNRNGLYFKADVLSDAYKYVMYRNRLVFRISLSSGKRELLFWNESDTWYTRGDKQHRQQIKRKIGTVLNKIYATEFGHGK